MGIIWIFLAIVAMYILRANGVTVPGGCVAAGWVMLAIMLLLGLAKEGNKP